ncbi:mannonate dehydratase [Rhodovulum sulfidophilum]|uniref:Mannonate dehydratase n=1 Tax=Rhodovulum visakhapatnamense TaxID=364297 RepID=A0ABS1RHN0_9RHOB|nr:mannonate dehydratase [Rhodovulum visakhapatnamense]MBL3571214.1 mannonate dehydratase [Rhodovulum visakhapatnamense]MBL3579103.1 mannonate dehydratase [Rhodovulum visakhapatnamense]OLS45065.1 mannonate dehydratase [Rhodovulum sulfidophilum]
MRQTWRWFGPRDLVSIDDVRQAGAVGVVSALHHVPTGAVWTPDEIARRQAEIGTMKDGTPSTLTWDVVESLPVSEDIKKQKGDWRAHLDAYRDSLRHLAAAGIEVICYNFMPVLDWTRTDLAWKRPSGATCMRFDLTDFAAFDLFILARPGATDDYEEALQAAAEARFRAMSDADRDQLAGNVVFGLPGAAERFTLEDVRAHLGEYSGISEDRLRGHMIDFLSEIVPLAEELGLRLCCHPDDPPVPLLGLPRIMSTEAHYAAVMRAVDSPANGITLCSGSLGARADNDLPGMMDRLGDRVHFLHLRNVTRETGAVFGSFHEAEHLGGDTDMVALVEAALREEARRRASGRADWSIPFRPDHGQDILDDLGRRAQPGYPSIGRLKGLAELRGIIAALEPRIAV